MRSPGRTRLAQAPSRRRLQVARHAGDAVLTPCRWLSASIFCCRVDCAARRAPASAGLSLDGAAYGSPHSPLPGVGPPSIAPDGPEVRVESQDAGPIEARPNSIARAARWIRITRHIRSTVVPASRTGEGPDPGWGARRGWGCAEVRSHRRTGRGSPSRSAGHPSLWTRICKIFYGSPVASGTDL